MIKFKRQFDPKYKGTEGEINNQKSMTVPDMALTVADLMAGHTTNTNEGQYFDTEIPVILDINDIKAHRDELETQPKEDKERYATKKKEYDDLIAKNKKDAAAASKKAKEFDEFVKKGQKKEGTD